MSALIGVVLAAIALPQVLGYLYARRERQEIQQLIQNSRVDMQQQVQDFRAEMRDMGDRIERQLQVVLEKLSQHDQEIEELKAQRIVTPS